MSKNLKFNPTHRVLIKAVDGNHSYNLVTIDVNNGTFKYEEVGQSDTKIRAQRGINAEKLCYNGKNDYNLPLTLKEAQKVVDQFNAKRAELDFGPLEFYRLDAKS